MLEIEKVKDRIQQLDDSELKSLLLIIYARLDITINGNNEYESYKQTVKDLID